MSISFVYGVSIQGNCENAVFTFLPFYKQNITFFIFLTYHCCVVDFGYSEGESLSYCTCRITFSTIKEYSMGTTQPIRNKDELTAFRMYYKDIRPNSRNYCLIVMGLNTTLRIYFYQEHLQIPAYKQDAGISYCKDCCRQNSAG